ncbi:DUF6325 family protein [Herbiconiux flava]|uniref:DUF1269 domain-containing protein n=1 Tax=Herbiconiux flava TaxID=881268 RepID=A0A852STK3_9MICO|nr:DUF6325 family protein [Herbiconiux flava]NYD72055.1 hypothetical protein [Herbiconiux flava]GLK17982.1 hypothetical protein GCM10017602_24640 [Herbiconiux flava]
MTELHFGPVEILLVGFGSDRPDPGLVTALTDTLETQAVRLIDIVFLRRDTDGVLTAQEIEDVSDEYGFGTVELEASGIAGGEDLDELAEQVPPGTSAAVVVLEHVWARRLGSALAASGGEVLAAERIPAPVVNDLLTELRS